VDSGVDVGLGGATVLVGVGLGVAFGVLVGVEHVNCVIDVT
jgi:hypothetical protein